MALGVLIWMTTWVTICGLIGSGRRHYVCMRSTVHDPVTEKATNLFSGVVPPMLAHYSARPSAGRRTRPHNHFLVRQHQDLTKTVMSSKSGYQASDAVGLWLVMTQWGGAMAGLPALIGHTCTANWRYMY